MDRFEKRVREIGNRVYKNPEAYSGFARYGYYVMAHEFWKLGVIERDLYKEFMKVLYPKDWFILFGVDCK